MLMYTQFYNKVADTGFIYFNTRNLLVSQTAMIGKLSVQLQGSVAANASYTLYVADGRTDYRYFPGCRLARDKATTIRRYA